MMNENVYLSLFLFFEEVLLSHTELSGGPVKPNPGTSIKYLSKFRVAGKSKFWNLRNRRHFRQ